MPNLCRNLLQIALAHHVKINPPLPPHILSVKVRKKIAIVAAILNRHWEMKDDNFLWVQDDLAWNCRDCFVQFSVFQRKHHCRRCGGLFCGEHAPLVELITCLPADICRGRSHDELIASVNLNQKELLEPVRLCKTCSFEICHAQAVFEEVWANKEKLSFSYWNEVVLEGRASVHLSDCTFPVNYKELEQWIGLNDSVEISLEGEKKKKKKKKRFFTKGKWTKLFPRTIL